MSNSLGGRVRDLAFRLFDDGTPALPSETGEYSREELRLTVESAKQEWLDAQSYFNAAIETDLIDHAILTLQAAERKYMYWLKQYKNLE
ncbi:MAG: DUF2508 family protein [Firmicutes bacterium]|nr:DUF2508 family protein [Bacillota bacterium]NLO66449.1 DUF2508 family protein [Bacillota bacterium]